MSTRDFSEFKTLLDNPRNNILVDIHSCPIERASIDADDPKYNEYFIKVPRNIYVVLISDFGQNKIGEDNVQHQGQNDVWKSFMAMDRR